MITGLLLSAILTKPGATCAGSLATLGAFVGSRSAHVVRLDRVVPMDSSFQSYAIAFALTGSDHRTYLTFPAYRKLAPEMLGLLSYILGRTFSIVDSQSVAPATDEMMTRVNGPTFRVETCAAWQKGKPLTP